MRNASCKGDCKKCLILKCPDRTEMVCQTKMPDGKICGRNAHVLVNEIPMCRRHHCELRGKTYEPDVNEKL